MRGKTRKSVSKLLGIWTFFLFFLLQEAFPKAAFAFTSLNACARSKECLELIKDSSRAAVSAPTGAGVKATTLSTTNSTGTLTVSLQAVTNFAIVTGPTATYIALHYWNQSQNERAQNRAKENYCVLNPTDSLCGTRVISFDSPNNRIRVSYSLPRGIIEYKIKDCFVDWGQGPQNQGPGFSYRVPTGDHYYPGGAYYNECQGPGVAPLTLTDVRTGDVPWKNWPQQKRAAAVASLNNSDWQRLIFSMPVGRILNPGDKVNAPKILIPGQEIDNPNTLGDDRKLKTVPGEKAIPVEPDFDHDGDPDTSDQDDDNDGKPDTSDPKPKNPYVPTVSSTPPPPPSDDRPNQSEGGKAVSKVRENYGDFLEKPENDSFENRLDTIEEKYRRAAEMGPAAAVDENVGYEQDRLLAEADSELQQLDNQIGEAWERSLSQYERQLFNNQPQATIDEMQMHMKQWDEATYEDVAHSILDHSSRKGYNPLDYLRAASNFDKSRARRTPPEGVRPDGTVKWENLSTREFIEVNEEGKIVTYGVNP